MTSSNELRICYGCKGGATGRRENYNYSECGLKNVVLKGVVVYRCTRCGSAHVEIPNMDGLHRTIALKVLCRRSLLSGDEIRFLRSVAGFTATQFAKALKVTKNALSRWENNHKIGETSERSIRITCGLAIIEEILNDQANAGSVNVDKVKHALKMINRYIANTVSDGMAEDPDEFVIDADFPFTVSVVNALPENRSSLVQ